VTVNAGGFVMGGAGAGTLSVYANVTISSTTGGNGLFQA
jgi:hypothetical protein